MAEESKALVTETIRLLRQGDRDLMEIALKTGLHYAWIQRMRSGNYGSEPGATRTQILYEHLTGRRLIT